MLNLAIEPSSGREPQATVEELGEVFTRRWVVELILDLARYRPEDDLATKRVLEPSCGDGAFLGPIIDRLIASAEVHSRRPSELASAIVALDLSELNVERARKFATSRLVDFGLRHADAERLAKGWIRHGDFLLDADIEPADFVIGNPPYIRLENVPAARTAAYRAACPTMRGRSDVYVGFIERGLRLLREDGVLGFIVADRWMHNQYGASLRRLVSDSFSVDAVLEMHDVDAFEDEVSAYPAVTIIRRSTQKAAVLATTDGRFGPDAAESLHKWATSGRTRTIARTGFRAARMDGWFDGNELWPSGDPGRLAMVRHLEERFAPLQSDVTRTRVGIGVATGADSVYVTRDAEVVEPDRLLPLLTSADIASGVVKWSGTYLVDPWNDGELVDLGSFPRLAGYLQGHESALRRRHIAEKRPHTWFRTIDRVSPTLLATPKLLLPDIKAASHPVLEEGRFYPHHNLYFVTSEGWDLEVLGGLLLSEVANLFVGAYCVKMRGGCYRFQAQYIRRIRVPAPDAIKKADRRALVRAFADRDTQGATAVAAKLYGIEPLPGWT
jgi:adenine-specific DNA-methyltransferase